MYITMKKTAGRNLREQRKGKEEKGQEGRRDSSGGGTHCRSRIRNGGKGNCHPEGISGLVKRKQKTEKREKREGTLGEIGDDPGMLGMRERAQVPEMGVERGPNKKVINKTEWRKRKDRMGGDG